MIKLNLVSDDGGLVRLQGTGEISQTRSPDEGDPLEGLLGPGIFARKVLLNLEGTDYIDSSGISWLILHHKRFRQAGGELVLHSLPPRVSQVLHFCRMDSVLRIAADEAAARAVAQGESRR